MYVEDVVAQMSLSVCCLTPVEVFPLGGAVGVGVWGLREKF